MKGIKFRAWDNQEKEWLNIKLFGFEGNDLWYVQAIDNNECDIDPPYFIDSDDVDLEQYTGLKDKNGTEIYEGDILRVSKFTFDSSGPLPDVLTVHFYSGMFQLARNGELLMGLHLSYIEDGEIIGNIHEHSHLLEDAT